MIVSITGAELIIDLRILLLLSAGHGYATLRAPLPSSPYVKPR